MLFGATTVVVVRDSGVYHVNLIRTRLFFVAFLRLFVIYLITSLGYLLNFCCAMRVICYVGGSCRVSTSVLVVGKMVVRVV